MTTAEIQKKAKFVADSSGKPKEVILPYNIYKKLLALETSMEIFRQRDTQESIGRAKEDIKKGRVKTFDTAEDAIKWLEK
jgi:hypothetical protein